MPAPAVSGIHHIKIPVGNLTESLRWYENVLDAAHQRDLDHIDTAGRTFASIITIPGVALPIELRWAPVAARGQLQCDTLILAITSSNDLVDWIAHLDAREVDHSPVLNGPGGAVLVIVDPDGKYIRMVAPLADEPAARDLTHQRLDPKGPWLNPIPMQHPRPSNNHDR